MMYIGFLINKLKISDYMPNKKATLLTFIGFILLLIESYGNYIHPSREGGFSSYLSLLILCPSLFILVNKMALFSDVKLLSVYATAIYLIHPFFILVIRKLTNVDHTLLALVVIVASIIGSFILIKINNKLKFIL